MRIWGIDYGSKLAGTTVIASLELEVLAAPKEMAKPDIVEKPRQISVSSTPVHLYVSEKKKDADRMILERADKERPDLIFIDAPLSLPGAYFGTDNDFFYRPVDREVGAMSPMFLGGLTARAMRLKTHLQKELLEVNVCESYPKLRARDLDFIDRGYKKDVKLIPTLLQDLLEYYPQWQIEAPVNTWHAFDALLALSSAVRFVQGEHRVYGPQGAASIYV